MLYRKKTNHERNFVSNEAEMDVRDGRVDHQGPVATFLPWGNMGETVTRYNKMF